MTSSKIMPNWFNKIFFKIPTSVVQKVLSVFQILELSHLSHLRMGVTSTKIKAEIYAIEIK